MATIIDGRAFAADLRARVGEAVAGLAARGVRPGLAVALLGDDPASAVYVRNKGKQTRAAGMNSFEHKLPADAGEDELLALVARLNADPQVHGILVQLPLPAHIDEAKIINAIRVDKDVDGFHFENVGRLSVGAEALPPCTPAGCLLLLREQLGDLTGRHAVVIGRSNIVGKPVAQLLLRAHCTVTIAHSRTRDLPVVCRAADILVAAVGVPQLVKGDWVRPGATVIDVGINRVAAADLDAAGGAAGTSGDATGTSGDAAGTSGDAGATDGAKPAGGATRLVGDVDFAAAQQVAGAITPVPGGVGPMTIACLLRNTLLAACRIHGIEAPAGL
ncbi:MAG: bifunctional methylenetetrahydrofolate dehydrogenase/methenyltetrahydrofolate cyclohydrolase [Gammaproteobacteria bacterium]|nr:bifunctional methylenetetrahydrofolate dehydrogenase/methenyltetrahydrofolate cyclohydrolase [Gammaproteobacteria bacterium]